VPNQFERLPILNFDDAAFAGQDVLEDRLVKPSEKAEAAGLDWLNNSLLDETDKH
jgi:hypothetical protein